MTKLNQQIFVLIDDFTQFLLNIFQEKQMEALVEKLCNRFSGVTGTHSVNTARSLIIFLFAKLIIFFRY